LLLNELGVAYFQQKDWEAAAAEFSAATKQDPSFATALANLAETERLRKRYKHAAVAYHKFLQLEKGDRYAIYGLALCFEGYARFDKSLKTLQVAERAAVDDDRLLARVNLAFRRVRRKMAQAKMPLLERGDAHLTAGRWAEALALYEEGLKKTPKDARLLGRRGLLLAIVGKLPPARRDLEAALLIDAGEPVARAAYALVLDRMSGPGEPPAAAKTPTMELDADHAARAFRAFQLELERDPESTSARLGRAEAGLRLGALDAAQQDFTAAGGKPAAAGVAELHWVRGATAESAESAEQSGGPSGAAGAVWRRSLVR